MLAYPTRSYYNPTASANLNPDKSVVYWYDPPFTVASTTIGYEYGEGAADTDQYKKYFDDSSSDIYRNELTQAGDLSQGDFWLTYDALVAWKEFSGTAALPPFSCAKS